MSLMMTLKQLKIVEMFIQTLIKLGIALTIKSRARKSHNKI